jgi:hypothetical protein
MMSAWHADKIAREGGEPISGMGQSTKRYMERHRILRTRDMEEAQAFLHGKGFEFDMAGRDRTRLCPSRYP